MTQAEFEVHARALLDHVYDVLVAKGRDYAEDGDHFANFNEVAKEAGTTPKQAWFQGFVKHYKRVNKWVRGRDLASESLEGSIVDQIAYLLLIHGHAADQGAVPLYTDDSATGKWYLPKGIKYDVPLPESPGRDYRSSLVDDVVKDGQRLYRYSSSIYEEDQ